MNANLTTPTHNAPTSCPHCAMVMQLLETCTLSEALRHAGPGYMGAGLTCTCDAPAESAPDPHVLHEACDEAAIRSLEESLESPEPTPEALEATRAMLEGMGGTLVEGPAWLRDGSLPPAEEREYAPDAATVQANRDHEGICEMLLEEDAWREHLPEGAEWSGPAYVPSPAPKVRDISPMFDTHEADLEDEEFNAAEWELANTYTSDPDDQGLADALLDAITDGEFTACMNHAEHREVASLGFSRQDRDGMHIISAE